jgi:hypothetical protein
VKIKRFVGTDMRQVLRRVREDQGPDAVILSNRRVDDGIEVVAAVDYDEALMQQALGSQPAVVDCSRPAASAGSAAAAAETVVEVAPAGPAAAVAAPFPDILKTGIALDRPAETTPEAGAADSDLRSLRGELSSLRGLLETQLSGLVWKDASRRSPLRAGAPVVSVTVPSMAPVASPALWPAPAGDARHSPAVTSEAVVHRVANILPPMGRTRRCARSPRSNPAHQDRLPSGADVSAAAGAAA